MMNAKREIGTQNHILHNLTHSEIWSIVVSPQNLCTTEFIAIRITCAHCQSATTKKTIHNVLNLSKHGGEISYKNSMWREMKERMNRTETESEREKKNEIVVYGVYRNLIRSEVTSTRELFWFHPRHFMNSFEITYIPYYCTLVNNLMRIELKQWNWNENSAIACVWYLIFGGFAWMKIIWLVKCKFQRTIFSNINASEYEKYTQKPYELRYDLSTFFSIS